MVEPKMQADVPDPFRMPLLNDVDIFEADLRALQNHLESGTFNSEELAQYCLSRIHATNKYLECVTEVNPDAISIAKQCDERRRDRGRRRSMLEGIPVLLKDNMATFDKMETTAGSFALLGSRPPRDSHIAHRLRTSGAIILGKSNMDEWAGSRSSVHSVGYSPRGGQTRNPYDLTREGGGSSTGSAVAVAAGLVPIAFGTETDSSIVWPAMKCGICGFKPTVGVTSRAGIVPISKSQDSVGPLARTVADVVYALDAIAGPDWMDQVTIDHDHKRPASDYAHFLDSKADGFRGVRFGIPMRKCFDHLPPDHEKLARRFLKALETSGAQIVKVDFPSIEERFNDRGDWDWMYKYRTDPHLSEGTVCLTEFYNGMNVYLSQISNTNIKSIDDIVSYNQANKGTEGASPGDHSAFPSGQDVLTTAAETKGEEGETYDQALRWTQKQCRENGIDAALKGFEFSRQQNTTPGQELDALLLFDRKGVGMQYAAQAQYPILCIPIGVDDDGLPLSVSIQHHGWQEGALIRWGAAIEHLWRRTEGAMPTPKYRNWRSKNIPVAMVQ